MAGKARYINKHRKTLCKGILGAGLFGVLGAMSFGLTKSAPEAKKMSQKPTDTVLVIKNPYVDVAYLTDTLEKPGTALLVNQHGKITRNYVENNNLYRLDLALFVHEWWHSQNHALFYEYKYMTPHEYYKICMHNEITANLAALLTVRLEYMVADNKAEVL